MLFKSRKLAQLHDDRAWYIAMYSRLIKRDFMEPFPIMIEKRINEIEYKLKKLGWREDDTFRKIKNKVGVHHSVQSKR